MLTPSFELEQNDDFIVINIKAPFAKVSEAEIFIEGHDLRFHSKPYFLRLTLPGEILEDGRENAKYDADSGMFTIRVAKTVKGQHFEGLDMLTKLLAPVRPKPVITPVIEVLDDSPEKDEKEGDNDECEDEFDWQIEQEAQVDEPICRIDAKYGFANQRSGVFKRLQEELVDVIDLLEADSTPECDRAKLRAQCEKDVFNDDRYMADFGDEDGSIRYLCVFVTESNKEYQLFLQEQDPHDFVKLTEKEKGILRQLPRKEHFLDNCWRQRIYLGLVDILCAYAYNQRVTKGEENVESAWTICKLSGTLSWLQTYNNIKDVVVDFFRASLCHPLYRNWALSQKCMEDVYQILKLGRRKMLKCFLEIRDMLAGSDSKYVLNDLYITDYCVWIQSISTKQLDSLAENLKQVQCSKAEVDFDLDVLDQACRLAIAEAAGGQLASEFTSAVTLHSSSEGEETSSSESTELESSTEYSSSEEEEEDDVQEADRKLKDKSEAVDGSCLDVVQATERTNKQCLLEEITGGTKSSPEKEDYNLQQAEKDASEAISESCVDKVQSADRADGQCLVAEITDGNSPLTENRQDEITDIGKLVEQLISKQLTIHCECTTNKYDSERNESAKCDCKTGKKDEEATGNACENESFGEILEKSSVRHLGEETKDTNSTDNDVEKASGKQDTVSLNF